jgi:hypothetical protein
MGVSRETSVRRRWAEVFSALVMSLPVPRETSGPRRWAGQFGGLRRTHQFRVKQCPNRPVATAGNDWQALIAVPGEWTNMCRWDSQVQSWSSVAQYYFAADPGGPHLSPDPWRTCRSSHGVLRRRGCPISGRQWGYGAALTGSIGGRLPVRRPGSWCERGLHPRLPRGTKGVWSASRVRIHPPKPLQIC